MMSLPKIEEVKQVNEDLTHVTWIVNNICPNTCVYCPPEIHNGSNHNYDWDNARRFLDLLFERYPTMHFSIGGGEPSMSPFFPELVKKIHEAGHTITVTSNAYKSSEYWREIGPYIKQISFSYHPEFSTEQYFNNVLATADVTFVTARVMMLSSHWTKCIQAYARLLQHDSYVIEIVRVYDWGTRNGSDQYTEEQINWMDTVKPRFMPYNHQHSQKPQSNNSIAAEYYFDDGTIGHSRDQIYYTNRGQTNFKGYECDLGLRSLWIGPLGQIKRGNCMAGGIIGSINEPESIQWPTKSIICPYNICGCSSDVNINKRRIPNIIVKNNAYVK
jgi:organic radical activating enzyme